MTDIAGVPKCMATKPAHSRLILSAVNPKHGLCLRTTTPRCLFPIPPGKKMTEIMGTPEYMAPEQILGSYGPEIDMWSAGVVMYLAMCGVPPFWASSRRAVKEAILSKDASFASPRWASVSGECKDLISRMLNKNPRKRVTPLTILGAFLCKVCARCGFSYFGLCIYKEYDALLLQGIHGYKGGVTYLKKGASNEHGLMIYNADHTR